MNQCIHTKNSTQQNSRPRRFATSRRHSDITHPQSIYSSCWPQSAFLFSVLYFKTQADSTKTWVPAFYLLTAIAGSLFAVSVTWVPCGWIDICLKIYYHSFKKGSWLNLCYKLSKTLRLGSSALFPVKNFPVLIALTFIFNNLIYCHVDLVNEIVAISFFSWANKFEPMCSSWCHVESIFAYRRIYHPNWRYARGFIRIQFDSDHSGEICTRTMMVHWAWVLSIRDFVVIKIAVTRVPYSIACVCKGENHNLKPDICQKLLLFFVGRQLKIIC